MYWFNNEANLAKFDKIVAWKGMLCQKIGQGKCSLKKVFNWPQDIFYVIIFTYFHIALNDSTMKTKKTFWTFHTWKISLFWFIVHLQNGHWRIECLIVIDLLIDPYFLTHTFGPTHLILERKFSQQFYFPPGKYINRPGLTFPEVSVLIK